MSRFTNLEINEQNNFEPSQSAEVHDAAHYMEEADAAFRHADFEQALRAYGRVLEQDASQAPAWTGQVRMLIELGEFREAKMWADKALERFPHEPELLAAKAVALGRMGDYRNAMAFSDAAVEERGDSPYVWLARADVFLSREAKRAQYCFEKALSYQPMDWFCRWLASRICYYYRRFSVAFKYAREALELDAAQSMVWLQLGRCQMALGLAGHAEQSFAQVLCLDPKSQEAQWLLEQVSHQGNSLIGWWRRLWGG